MIYLNLPFVPPSSNKAYFNLPKGGRTLSKEGKKFKRLASAHFAQNFPTELAKAKPDVPYLLMVCFTIPTLYNKGWEKGTATKRYKKLDLSNRLKLLEDVLSEVMDIDDSQNLQIVLQKKYGEEEFTEVWFWSLEEEETPFADILG